MVANEEHDKIGQLIKQSFDVPKPGEEFVRSLAARARQELGHALRQQSRVDARRTWWGSPIARVAAAAVLALAIGGVALWSHTAGTTFAFADFIQPILEAKTAKFKATFEYEGQRMGTAEVMVMAPYRAHVEEKLSGQSADVVIVDFNKAKSVRLTPAEKRATVTNLTNLPKERTIGNWFEEMRSYLRAAQNPDVKRESLGEKEIDGRRVIGYRLSGCGLHEPGSVIRLWGDPQTGLPVWIEQIDMLDGKEKMITMGEFVFNVDLDESLFSLEPPAGYTVINDQLDASLPEEKDLIEALRLYSGLSGGGFPDTLTMRTKGVELFEKRWRKSGPRNGKKSEEQQNQEWLNVIATFTRGAGFAIELSPEADTHYAGKGVSLGAANTPIFWYRPKDARTFRVIYADLSARDADTPPSMPNAQPVPAQPSPKQ